MDQDQRATTAESTASRPAPGRGPRPRNRWVWTATLFEVGLGLVAAMLAWAVGHPLQPLLWGNPLARFSPGMAVVLGLVAAAPLFVLLVWFDGRPPPPLRGFRDQVRELLVPLFGSLSIGQLALLSLAAGVGEELLFRGFLQPIVSGAVGGTLGMAVGLLAAALVFGACHWMNATYAALAAGVGAYLGGLLLLTEQLGAPIATHAAYDFAALLYLTRGGPATGRRAA